MKKIKNNIDVSIIIVNWNTKNLLIQCIKSIIRTTKKYKYEIIIVDNNSKDGSKKAIKKEFPQVKLIENSTNLGFGKANNIGAKASKGRYLCFSNTDIIIKDNAIDLLINKMDEDINIGIIGPKLLNHDFTIQVSCKRYPTIWNNLCLCIGINNIFKDSKYFCGEHYYDFNHNIEKRVQALVGAFFLISRKLFEKIDGFDEKFFMYGEEVDLCKRVKERGCIILFYPEAEVVHYGRASSSIEPLRFLKESYISKQLFWKKHYNKYSQLLFVSIAILRQMLRIIRDTNASIVNKENKNYCKQVVSSRKDIIKYLIKNF